MMNGATPPDFAVRLLEDVCERTRLLWKARHVYLQKRRNKNGADSWQAVLSIDGFRAVGARHPDYAGQEGPYWVTGADGTWTDIPPDGKPYASKVGIRKKSGLTTWGTAKFSDYYAGMMWDKFPTTMIAKCAEMLAWRKTFPETFGGLYGDAELAQKDPKGNQDVVMGEAEVPPKDEPRAYNDYKAQLDTYLKGEGSLVEVQALGKKIQADKTLTVEEVGRLHFVYTAAKKKHGG
jgi:hypothetical protein